MGALGLQLHRPSIRVDVPTKVFEHFSQDEIEHLLACTYATARPFKRGDVLISPEEKSALFGIVLKGTVLLTDAQSSEPSPVDFANAGDHFGADRYSSANPTETFTAIAATAGSAALLDLGALQNLDGHVCDLRSRLSNRLLELAAESTVRTAAYRKLLEHESLRDRLVQFFLDQQVEQGSDKLLVTLNREQLASYLGTDKVSLARELKAMKDEEHIDFYRSSFRILKGLSAG